MHFYAQRHSTSNSEIVSHVSTISAGALFLNEIWCPNAETDMHWTGALVSSLRSCMMAQQELLQLMFSETTWKILQFKRWCISPKSSILI